MNRKRKYSYLRRCWTDSASSMSFESDNPNALASDLEAFKLGFRKPRSTSPMYVGCSPAFSASNSCETPIAVLCRRSAMAKASDISNRRIWQVCGGEPSANTDNSQSLTPFTLHDKTLAVKHRLRLFGHKLPMSVTYRIFEGAKRPASPTLDANAYRRSTRLNSTASTAHLLPTRKQCRYVQPERIGQNHQFKVCDASQLRLNLGKRCTAQFQPQHGATRGEQFLRQTSLVSQFSDLRADNVLRSFSSFCHAPEMELDTMETGGLNCSVFGATFGISPTAVPYSMKGKVTIFLRNRNTTAIDLKREKEKARTRNNERN